MNNNIIRQLNILEDRIENLKLMKLKNSKEIYPKYVRELLKKENNRRKPANNNTIDENYVSFLFTEQYKFNSLYEQICLDEGIIGDFFKNIKDKSSEFIISYIEKRKSNIDNFMKSTENFLNKKGVDLEPFKKKIKSIILKYKDPAINAIKKKNMKKLVSIVKEAAVESKSIFRMFFDIKSFTIENVAKAIIIFACMYGIAVLINSVFLTAFTLFLPLEVAKNMTMFATILIQAPIVEETAKYISIKEKSGGEFLLSFNIFEFSSYMIMLLSTGIPLIAAIIMRLKAVGMHYSTAFIQAYMQKVNLGTIGLFLAMIFHGCWNFLAVINQV